MTSCYSCTGSCTSSVTHVRSKSHPTTEHSSNYQLIVFSVCIFLISQVSGTYTDLGANSDDYTYEQVGWSPDKSMKEATFVWQLQCLMNGSLFCHLDSYPGCLWRWSLQPGWSEWCHPPNDRVSVLSFVLRYVDYYLLPGSIPISYLLPGSIPI